MSWRVLGECVEQAAFDGAGLVSVRADLGGPAQGGHDDLANAICGSLLLTVEGRAPMKIDPEEVRRMAMRRGLRRFG